MIERVIPLLSVILLLGAIFYSLYNVIRKGEDSYQRRVYITILAYWAVPVMLAGAKQIHYIQNELDIFGYLHCNGIISGIFALMTLIWYALAVLFHKQIKLKGVLWLIIPAIVVVVANLVWNKYAGLTMDHYYPTFEDFKANMFSVTVLLRFAVIVVELLYILFLVYSVVRLVPIYNKYLSDTQSNERYNLHWMYIYIIALCTISAVYFIVTFVPTSFTFTLYCTISAFAFIALTRCVWEYKNFPKFDEVNLRWSLREGWSADFADTTVEYIDMSSVTPKTVEDIEKYIIDNNLYANVDLTMKDLLTHFQDINSITLVDLLKCRGLTFQSFIRDIRIKVAVHILTHDEYVMQYKDIYYRVGFSHYSSFARAFTAVVGVSPSNYRESIKKKSISLG